jgi:hypothetical protein
MRAACLARGSFARGSAILGGTARTTDVLGVLAPSPLFIAPSTAFAAGSPLGEQVTIGEEIYVVRTVEPDGAGVVRLRLERAD